ncbi:hypothetical protein SUDANB1_07133 [Streptomyces sp. enrichment culture]|uniref:hypothetical protein n=1 Tax=Streptomyces sp. enrichment culture TaxID=1795815 RepID=UPI003F54C0AF
MTRPRLQWQPDDGSAAILAAYARRREPWRNVLARALRLLARADGILDQRGRVIAQPRTGRRP